MGRGQHDSGTRTERMKESPCLSTIDGDHRQSSQIMVFHQPAPQLLINIGGLCSFRCLWIP